MSRPLSLPDLGLWKHFLALSAIPRPSGHEAKAGEYVAAVAREHGLQCRTDQAGNRCVTKAATKGLEHLAPVVLQAHLDMVPQRTRDSVHDFTRDPLTLLRDGDWLHADRTTLGADNGIGAAAALAVLSSDTLAHGPITALFTVEEEIGLRGAAKVGADFLPGEFLFNLDADNPEELIIGCAGALDLRATFTCGHDPCPASRQGYTLTLGGLSGGHSGADIHRGRGNAILLLGRVLSCLADHPGLGVASLTGGDARNAIPREAVATLALDPADVEGLRTRLETQLQVLRNEFQGSDPGLTLELRPAARPGLLLCPLSASRLVSFLQACPNGALRFSDAQAGVVETSSNLGVAATQEDGTISLHFLVRSCVDSAKENLGRSITALVRLAGGQTSVHGNYPGWQPSTGSRLVPLFSEACSRRLGRAPAVLVVHGGLECGLLKAANPALDCISFGPVIQNMHSPEERVSISSVQMFWEILCDVLGRVPAATRPPA